MDSVPSRVEDILLALINNSEYDGPIISRVEQILYSFLENSEYITEPESRVEAILVALKAAGLYDDAVVSRIEKILYSKLNGTEYAAEPESRIEELLLEWELIEEKELTGVVPLLFNADGTPLLDYLISGNTVQSGTPTPDNPVIPQGTGERTGNLFDKTATNVNNGYITNGFLNSDGTVSVNVTYRASEYIRLSQNQAYILYYGSNLNLPSVCFYDSSKNYISGVNYAGRWDVRFTTPQNAEYLRFSFRWSDKSVIRFNLGSEVLPYEPYGYKIPISSASTTTPVYLGEVESTRRIKKLVLTGEETWSSYSGVVYLSNVIDYLKTDGIIVICTHYRSQSSVEGVSETEAGHITFSKGSNYRLYIRDSNYTTGTNFKTYLAAQYAAGTPVTIWYVLATEKTGIVNEPLRKIGDYADSVSKAQAGVEISTVNGSNTLDVNTTVKPSEVYIKYKGR